MLKSLYIKNYRNLEELEIKTLGRVNLLVGKNNTGKSSVLEALAIYAACGDLSEIVKILQYRYETIKNDGKSTKFVDTYELERLFNFKENNQARSADEEFNIVISPINKANAEEYAKNDFVELFIQPEKSSFARNANFFSNKYNESQLPEQTATFIAKWNEGSATFFYNNTNTKIEGEPKVIRHKLIHASTFSLDENAELWDQIIFTNKEEIVNRVLKLLEPKLDRIYYRTAGSLRVPIYKLEGSYNQIPLGSMGDGINRILSLVLALVNCEGGFLLIDEFENGLHHSVQEKVWKILMQVADELDVQVFATTHSEDCIRAFTRSLISGENFDGRLIRLENRDGKIAAEEYDREQLDIVIDNGIEIR